MTQDEEWEVARAHLGLPPSGGGPEIPRILHRFWTGGPMREGAFRFLLDSARAAAHGWTLISWRSRDIEEAWDCGADGRPPTLRADERAIRDSQRAALARAGYALRSIEELLSPEAKLPLSDAIVRQVKATARVAAEHPDAGEERVNVKCFSDVARLVYLRALGGLHLDVDIGLGDMELDSVLRHHDLRGQVPLFGALGRDTESAPEVAEDLRAAREARRRGVLDREKVKHLAERALLGARAYNAVIATRPDTEHLDAALRALLDDAARSGRDLPSGMSVQRVLLCGPLEVERGRGSTGDRGAEEALETAMRLSIPAYLTRLDQLTSESDRAPVVPEAEAP